MRVNVLRQRAPETAPYWEAFDYDGPADTTVAGLLDYLNYNDDIRNAAGERTARIAWDCACLQGVCGACAMVIDGVPALACETFLREVPARELTLRPLRKFPVVRDLVVDRSVIQERLRETNVFIGAYRPDAAGDRAQQYDAAKCLKCGLCLEVCPNYADGTRFFGAVFANDCYLAASRSGDRADALRLGYAEHFASACSKSLSCMEVCPMHIETVASMAWLNRSRRSGGPSSAAAPDCARCPGKNL